MAVSFFGCCDLCCLHPYPAPTAVLSGTDCELDCEWVWELIEVKSGHSFWLGYAELWSLLWSSFLPGCTVIPAWLRKGSRGGNEQWWQDCDGGGGWWRPLQLVLLPKGMFTEWQPSGMSGQIPWKSSVSQTKSCFPAQCALLWFIYLFTQCAWQLFGTEKCSGKAWSSGCRKGKSLVLDGRHPKSRASSSKKGASENMVSLVTGME